jgi:hypothetical protein
MYNDISGVKRLHGTASPPAKQGNHAPTTAVTTSPQRSPPPKRERTEDKKTSRQPQWHSPGAGGDIISDLGKDSKPRTQNKNHQTMKQKPLYSRTKKYKQRDKGKSK